MQGFALVSNNRDFNQDRGPSNFDATHRWVTSGIVELPLGKGKRFLDRAGWMDKVFGGLQFSGVLRLQSGFPFTPFIRNRLSNTGYISAWERGDLVGDPYFTDTEWSERVRRWQSGIGRLFVINPSAISLDYAPGTFGNIGRNAFRMPYNRHLELAATKRIRLGEVARLELHAEVFNVTNERLYRFDQINNVRGRDGLTDPNRGSIPKYVFLFNPRVIQLGLRFAF